MADYSNNRINDDAHFCSPPLDIVCKTCAFRKPDYKVNGQILVPGHTNGYCQVYTPENTNGKPNGILFDGEGCKYYRKDESDE